MYLGPFLLTAPNGIFFHPQLSATSSWVAALPGAVKPGLVLRPDQVTPITHKNYIKGVNNG
jgi:hypothetical protein